MIKKSNSIRGNASTEATLWMIRFQENPGDEILQREFNIWLDNPINAAAWEETQRISDLVKNAPPTHANNWKLFLDEGRINASESSHAISNVTLGPQHLKSDKTICLANKWKNLESVKRSNAVALGALAATILIFVFAFGPHLLRNWGAHYATGTAELKTVQLADNSVVTLAPDSAIAVSFTEQERLIRLLSGEAFFQVTSSVDRPFRVLTDNVQVTVLGTEFSLHRGSGTADVGVAHGVVQVESDWLSELKDTLKAGESVHVDHSGKVVHSQMPVSQIAAWRQHQFIAEDRPLAEVVDQLRHYFNGVIIVTNKELASQPVTGVIKLDDPLRALRGIAQSQHARIRQITPWLIVISNS